MGSFRFIPHRMKELTTDEYNRMLRRPEKIDLHALQETYAALPEKKREFRRSEYNVTELNELYRRLVLGRAEPGPDTPRTAGAQEPGQTGGGPSGVPQGKTEAVKLPALPIDEHLADKKLEQLFGTLVHYVIHSRIKSGRAAAEVPPAYTADFPEKLRGPVLEQAETLARGFFASDLGRLLENAEEVETEFPFLYKLQAPKRTYFVHGVPDLLFRAGENYYVIDFKTDKLLDPLDYALQLALYKKACTALVGREPECLLFALRGARPLSVTHTVEWGKLFAQL
jgi:ATP-dependent exoDNAse (exonuclease V) beta subunit